MNPQKLILIGSALGTAGMAAAAAWLVRTARRRGWSWARDPAPIEPLVWLIGALILFIAPVTGASATTLFPAAWVGLPESFERQAAAQALGYATAITVGITLVWSLRMRASPNTGLRARWSDVPIGAAALLLFLPVYLLVSQVSLILFSLLSSEPPGMVKHQTLEQLRDHPSGLSAWLMIAAAAVGAPIVEELTYRLCLQSFLRRLIAGGSAAGRAGARTREVGVAVACTSGLFALTHLSAVPWSAVPSLFVLGLALGVAYEWTGRLGVPIVMHAMFNAANIAVVRAGWVG